MIKNALLDNNKAFFFVICFGKLIAALRLFVYDFSFYIKQNAYTMYALKITKIKVFFDLLLFSIKIFVKTLD